jgi:hypothetical protein
MRVVVQQDAVVYGQCLDVQDVFTLNYGVLAATVMEHVHVTDAITIKAPVADLIIPKWFQQHQGVHTECVLVVFIDV